MKFSLFHACTLVFFALCLFGSSMVNAQERILPGFEEARGLDELPTDDAANSEEVDSLPLDNAITSALNGLPAILKQWEKKHLVSYLSIVCIALGVVLGVCVALLAHFNTPPHGLWTEVRRKSSLLATSMGAGLSILLVTLHFSVPAHAKITYLVMAFVFCSISAGISCALGLSILRKVRIRRAKKWVLRSIVSACGFDRVVWLGAP